MAILQKIVDINMTTYQDICIAWDDYKSNQRETYLNLVKLAELLRKELGEDLELTGKTWNDDNGKVYRYVEIGESDSQKFILKDAFSINATIDHDVMYLPFSIAITLEKGANMFPKEKVFVDMTIGKKNNNNGIVLSFKDSDGDNKMFDCGDINAVDFKDVISHYKEAVLKVFK